MRMLSWIAAASIVGSTALAAAPAQASGGCWPGYHPTLWGCHINAPVRVVVVPALVHYHRHYWHPYAW
jgi:hypothetical protein